MNIFIGVIIGLFVLMFLVTAHEFGHFIMARRNGVKVIEFGIGIPPRAIAWTKQNGHWRRLSRAEAKLPQENLILSFNWLPIGGFCQMDGESANDKRPHTFGSASFSSKTKILFGGVLANWLIGWFILTILAWTGMPNLIPNQFQIPADTHLTPISETQTLAHSTWSASIVGAGLTIQITAETLKGIGQLFWNLISGFIGQFSFDQSVREQSKIAIGTASDAVSGPVGIIGIIFPAFAATGVTNLAFLTAIISISLACINIIPIPALDGGRWLLIAFFKLRKKPLSKAKEQAIISRTFLILLILILLVTILDISRFFK